MERWQRSFAQNDKDFKELFGVKKEIFLQLRDILSAAALERRKKENDGQLLLPLQYWREYRTKKHFAFGFGNGKSTVNDTITLVENVLIKNGAFRLPGKKSVMQ